MKKNGFTLIELLAVIIILAVIALIATPLVINVVTGAKTKANQASIYGYADGLKLAVYDYMYKEDTFGQKPNVDKAWAEANMELNNKEVSCEGVFYSDTYSSVLNKCKVSDSEKEYCLAKGKIYECDNSEFTTILGEIGGSQTSGNLRSTLLGQYVAGNETGLVQDSTNTDSYYYTGTNEQVGNNFVWYEGHLWRVIQINSDNTITMITQQPITAIQPTKLQADPSAWETQEAYESSYINTWLNDVFYSSISDKGKIKKSTFNVGIYDNVSEITTTQYVGLSDVTQYTKAGLANSFLDIKEYFWLGNRYGSRPIFSVHASGDLGDGDPTSTYGVRPVIKISDLTVTSGNGTLSDPFRENSRSTNTSNVKIGEYISVPGSSSYCGNDARCLFRVVSKDSDSIKVILNGLLPTTSEFGSIPFSISSTIYTALTNFVGEISMTYRYSGNKTFNIGQYGNIANYTSVFDTKYSGNVGLPVIGELLSGNDIDVETATKTFVNVNTIENPSAAGNFWAMNAYSPSRVRFVTNNGLLNAVVPTSVYGVRPVIFLNLGTNSDLTFTKGEGTAESPYWLGN